MILKNMKVAIEVERGDAVHRMEFFPEGDGFASAILAGDEVVSEVGGESFEGILDMALEAMNAAVHGMQHDRVRRPKPNCHGSKAVN
jgi:hypothetical protein